MNKKLMQQLYKESLVKRKSELGENITFFDYEQFAELILFDVLKLIDDTYWSDPNEVYELREMIVKHFGVEE